MTSLQTYMSKIDEQYDEVEVDYRGKPWHVAVVVGIFALGVILLLATGLTNIQ